MPSGSGGYATTSSVTARALNGQDEGHDESTAGPYPHAIGYSTTFFGSTVATVAATDSHAGGDSQGTAVTSSLVSTSMSETYTGTESYEVFGGGLNRTSSSSSRSFLRIEATREESSVHVALGLTESTLWATLSFTEVYAVAYAGTTINTPNEGAPGTTTTSGMTTTTSSGETTGVTTFRATAGAAGAKVETSTTATCEHHGTTTQTWTFTTTQISDSAGSLTTTTVTLTDMTTASTSYTVTVAATTTLTDRIAENHFANTVLLAAWGNHLFAAAPASADGVGAAGAFYSIQGTRITLSPTYSSTVTGVTQNSSFTSLILVTASSSGSDAFGFTSSSRGTTTSSTSYTISKLATAVEYGLVTNSPVSEPYAPTWEFGFPTPGESGAATLSLTGPATLSLTLVRGGTELETTSTVSASSGATATFTFEPGVAIAARGCMAYAAAAYFAEYPLPYMPFNVIEVPCFEGWLPRCS